MSSSNKLVTCTLLAACLMTVAGLAEFGKALSECLSERQSDLKSFDSPVVRLTTSFKS